MTREGRREGQRSVVGGREAAHRLQYRLSAVCRCTEVVRLGVLGPGGLIEPMRSLSSGPPWLIIERIPLAQVAHKLTPLTFSL